MDRTIPSTVTRTEAEMLAELDVLQLETRRLLEEIKTDREQGAIAWAEARRYARQTDEVLAGIEKALSRKRGRFG